MASKIEWCQETWNPITSCIKISEGCKNCYAERMAKRLKGRFEYPKDDPFRVTFHPDKLKQPVKWKKPRRIFVCSMGDLFHDDVKKSWIDDILAVVSACPQHQFLLLTKRAENIEDKLYGFDSDANPVKEFGGGDYLQNIWQNIWLGVTAENQNRLDERLWYLFRCFFSIRFVSLEPLLGPINFLGRLWNTGAQSPHIDWVIAGCESGPGRRPAKIEWFRDIRDQCREASIPFFLKQMEVDGKIIKMPELDGQVWDQYPALIKP